MAYLGQGESHGDALPAVLLKDGTNFFFFDDISFTETLFVVTEKSDAWVLPRRVPHRPPT